MVNVLFLPIFVAMDNRKSTQTLPSTTYYGFILVKNGTSVCGRFPVIRKEVKIGRDKNCDIRIVLENVSNIHCSLYYINDKVIKYFYCLHLMYK